MLPLSTPEASDLISQGYGPTCSLVVLGSRHPASSNQEPPCTDKKAKQHQDCLALPTEGLRQICFPHLLAEHKNVHHHHYGEQNHANAKKAKRQIAKQRWRFLSRLFSKQPRDRKCSAIHGKEQTIPPVLSILIILEAVRNRFRQCHD